MWFASNKEVMCMIETELLMRIIYILFYALIEITIIALAVIITLVIILGKNKAHL